MLKTQNLGYKVQGKNLLKEINLEFNPGKLYGILGPNGSGKSTLLKCMTGIWKPTCGQVLWKNELLHHKEKREISRTLSLVPQNPPIPFDFKVWDIVSMGRYPLNASYLGTSCPGIIEWALSVVDVWHLKDQNINCLSAGEKQRVYIARTLSTESPVILLDEPTACLDIKHQLQIWELLRSLVQQGKIVAVTIHDLNATERFCDKVAILDQGRCVASGSFHEVMEPSVLRQVFGVEAKIPKNQVSSFHLPN